MAQIALWGMLCLTLSAVFLLIGLRLVPTSLWPLLFAMACANGLGISLAYSGLMSVSMQGIAEAHHGLVSGLVTTAYFFGGGLGLSLLSPFLDSGLENGPVVGLKPLLLLGVYGAVGSLGLLIKQRS